jgi:hypothetical protein
MRACCLTTSSSTDSGSRPATFAWEVVSRRRSPSAPPTCCRGAASTGSRFTRRSTPAQERFSLQSLSHSRSGTAADASPGRPSAATRGTSTCKSKRSRSPGHTGGRGSRRAAATGTRTPGRDRPTARTGTGYRRRHGAPGGHAHGPRGPRDDDLAFVARWRRASSAGRVNSGSSSKNSTPRCASVHECSPKAPPGCGPLAFALFGRPACMTV